MTSGDLSSLLASQRLAHADDFNASRERWRAIASQLASAPPTRVDEGGVDPADLLDALLAALRGPRSDSLSSTRAIAAALKTLHVLLLARLPLVEGSSSSSAGGRGEVWLHLSQLQLNECVDALLATAHLQAPFKPIIFGHAGSSSSPLPRTTSQQSLRSFISDDDGGATTTDYASDAGRRPNQDGDADRQQRLGASCRSVRLNSLSCLAALNETRPALFFSQWGRLLLPDQAATSSAPSRGIRSLNASAASPSILGLIKSDTVLGVRIAAASLVEGMFRQAAQGRFLASGVVEQRASMHHSSTAFTSLAARMGALVASTRATLVEIIESRNDRRASSIVSGPIRCPPNPAGSTNSATSPPTAPLTEAILRALKALVLATPTAKLRRSHLDVLQGPLLRLSSHADPTVAIAAYVVLSTLSPASAGRMETAPAEVHETAPSSSSPVSGVIARIIQSNGADSSSRLDGEALAQAWSALSSFLSTRFAEVMEQEASLLARLQSHASHEEQAVRQACVAFVGASLEGKIAAASTAPDSPTELSSLYSTVAKKAAKDPSPLVRSEVAQALPSLLRLEAAEAPCPTSKGPTSAPLPPSTSILQDLLLDSAGGGEASVQAAAVRAVGVLFFSLSSSGSTAPPIEEAPTSSAPAPARSSQLSGISLSSLLAFTLSHALCPELVRSPALLVRLRAAWTLANVCQTVAESRAGGGLVEAHDGQLWVQLIGTVSKGLEDDERIACNAMRGVGLLLSVASEKELTPDAETNNGLSTTEAPLGVIYTILERSRTAKSPKLKWNAIIALAAALGNDRVRRRCSMAKALESGNFDTSLSSFLAEHLCDSVTTSRVFKVRLAAISALRRLEALRDFGGQRTEVAAMLEQVKTARDRVDADVAEATFREAQLHGEGLRRGLDGLVEHLIDMLNGPDTGGRR